jgi:hypothetical protein
MDRREAIQEVRARLCEALRALDRCPVDVHSTPAPLDVVEARDKVERALHLVGGVIINDGLRALQARKMRKCRCRKAPCTCGAK